MTRVFVRRLLLTATAFAALASGSPLESVRLHAGAAPGETAHGPGLTLSGDPQAKGGAAWTYQDSTGDVIYDLRGTLFRPAGEGPFPAILISHGTGGTAGSYGRLIADSMVTWGYVCIAVNYTHAQISANNPCGSPGACELAEYGATPNNILRAMKARDVLAGLGYVDTHCIMAYGHSRGAYVTTALVATHPDRFRAAGHTAGGIIPEPREAFPNPDQAASIAIPYILHHGDADNTVPLAMDSALQKVFAKTGNTHAFHVYPGLSHSQMSHDALMLARTRAWFKTYGCSDPVGLGMDTGRIPDSGPDRSGSRQMQRETDGSTLPWKRDGHWRMDGRFIVPYAAP